MIEDMDGPFIQLNLFDLDVVSAGGFFPVENGHDHDAGEIEGGEGPARVEEGPKLFPLRRGSGRRRRWAGDAAFLPSQL